MRETSVPSAVVGDERRDITDMSYIPGAGYPTLAALRIELGVPVTLLPDETLDLIAESEQDGTNSNYDWPAGLDLPAKLYQVFVRSCARTIAARGVPLGMVGTDSEFGVARLTTRDSEIVRIGGQYRKRTFA